MSTPIQKRQCLECENPATIFRSASSEFLCTPCFRSSIAIQVRETLSKWQMIHHSDRIAVAFSGGKDSTTLLSILVEVQQEYPELEIIAVTLDEGIAVADDRNLTVRLTTQLLGVEHVSSSYQELFSITMDEIAERARTFNSPLSPCAFCGVMRRQGLNLLARRLGADKLALGHNLDDEIQSMLMNIFQGDLQRLARFTPVQRGIPNQFIPRIKPLYNILEQEVALFAQDLNVPFYRCPCTYGAQSFRTEIRKWLNALEASRPGSKYNLSTTLMKIIPSIQRPLNEELHKCQLCSEPTSHNMCAVCNHLISLGMKPLKK